ncbi:MAG: hypothetical protein ACI4EL_08805 [Candidatus Fimimorpha sp.]
MNYYTGLKFFLGFAVYLIGFGYLIRDEKRSKLKYIICTIIAGGFHMMYYAFLLFAFIKKSELVQDADDRTELKQNRLIVFIVTISILLSVFLRINGSANVFLVRIFSFVESDKLNLYWGLSTNLGFYIPIVLQWITLYLAYKYRSLSERISDEYYHFSNTLFYVNLLEIVFYPLFMVSLTFARLVTSISLATITATGYKTRNMYQCERMRIVGNCFLVILVYCIRYYLLGNLWEVAAVPFFHLQ